MALNISCPRCSLMIHSETPTSEPRIICPQCQQPIAVVERPAIPPRSPHPLLYVMVGLSSMFVVLVAACAGVWFWYLQPLGKDAFEKVDQIKQVQADLNNPPPEPTFDWNQARQLKVGTGRDDVEQRLGVALKAEADEVADLANGIPLAQRARFIQRWHKQRLMNRVWVYRPERDIVLVCYDANDRLMGLVGRQRGNTSEFIALPPETTENLREETTPVATFAANDLGAHASAYVNRWIRVTGTYYRAERLAPGAFSFLCEGQVVARPTPNEHIEWKEAPEPLDTIEILAKVQSVQPPSLVVLTGVKVLQRHPPPQPIIIQADELTKAFHDNPDSAKKRYGQRILKVTGVVSSTDSTGNRVGLRGLQLPAERRGYIVEGLFEENDRGPAKNVHVGATITLVGYLQGTAKGNSTGVTTLEMVLSRVAP